MSYNDKKFLDVNGLKHLISILDDYPTNEVLGTVINAIESEIPTNVSQLQNDAGYLTTHQDISGKANNADLAAVATSGSYNDLSNKPTIPDIQIEGYSIVENGVANIPHGSDSQLGVIRTDARYGIAGSSSGVPQLSKASSLKIKEGTDEYRPIVPENQHESAFYGLAKAAGYDEKNSTEATGIYTDGAKAAIQNMLGITDLLSTEETTTATAAHALNSLFLMGGKLYKATAAIAIGDAVVEGTNCQVVKIEDVFIKNTDYATTSSAGVVKLANSNNSGLYMGSDKNIKVCAAPLESIKAGTNYFYPITSDRAYTAVFYGLSKASGVDLANEDVTVGTYPETSKTAIRSLIGAAAASDVTVSDVRVNGTSVLSNGVANVPISNASTYGVVKSGIYGINNDNGELSIRRPTDAEVKSGDGTWRVLNPAQQHQSTFYGLAKAAGADEKDSTLPIGTYTETAKSAIRNMLGAASTNIVAVQDEQPTDTDTKVWLPETQAAGIEVPTYAEFQQGLASKVSDVQVSGTSIVNNGVATIPIGSTNNYGLMRTANGITSTSGVLRTYYAREAEIKTGTEAYNVIVPYNTHVAAFYGLAKAAGDTTQSQSDNAVGTYTADASAAIRSMLGAVGDVQANGTSVVSDGVANLPYATANRFGVTKIGSGLQQGSDGSVMAQSASTSQIKDGLSLYNAIMPGIQHQSVFYGLAKLAGVDMASSSNEIGTYTSEAKAAIQTMLGIDLSSIAAEVEIPLVETVSGTTPSITGQPNTRYVCGEVSTLSITPPSAGSIDVIFDSGSTPAVITVPNTVRWPAWFDATALEADTTYEILITDGVYGSVMTWAN